MAGIRPLGPVPCLYAGFQIGRAGRPTRKRVRHQSPLRISVNDHAVLEAASPLASPDTSM